MYTIFISELDGFGGTGFCGENFGDVADLKQIFRKYVTKCDAIYKIRFNLASNINNLKAYIHERASKDEAINPLELTLKMSKNPFEDITIFYCRNGWYDEQGDFLFILDEKENLKPQYNKKLAIILRELGMEI